MEMKKMPKEVIGPDEVDIQIQADDQDDANELKQSKQKVKQ